MSVDALENSIVKTSYNASVAESFDTKSTENAQEASSVVLTGDSITVSSASASGTTSVAPVTGKDQDSEAMTEFVAALYQNADELEAFAGELQAIALASGIEAPAGGAAQALPRTDMAAVVNMAQDVADGKTQTVTANSAAGEASDTGKTQDTYFSIYQLMTLMLEIAQEERDAAFELSKANLEVEISSINTQATKQRRAGELGAIVGIVTCVAQVCVSAISLGMQIKSVSAPENTGAGMNNKQAQTALESTEAASQSSEASAKNTEKIANKTSEENRMAVEEKMAGSTKAGQEYGQLKGELQSQLDIKAQNQVAISEKTTQTTANNQKIASNNDKLAGKGDPNVNGAPKTLSSDERAALTKENEALAKENTRLNSEISECQGKVDSANKSIEELTPKVQEAQSNYKSALRSELNGINAEYDAASSKTIEAENKYYSDYKMTGLKTNSANTKSADAARGTQKNLGQQRSLMEAKVLQAESEMGIKPSENDIKAAAAKVGTTESACSANKSYRAAMGQQQKWGMAMQALPGMVQQLGNSVNQMVSGVGNAEATEEGAHQKEADFNLQQAQQLYSQAQDLINTTRETLRAVYEAESQLNQKIIQA